MSTAHEAARADLLERAPGAGAADRLAYLDLARCVAIVLMVFAHLGDQLLAPEAKTSILFHWYAKTRGITAPLFFVVAGWAFAYATIPRLQRFRRWGPPLSRRLRRIGALYLCGYLLTLPWWASGFPFRVPSEVWTPFWAFGVLQCVATALLVSHLLALVAGRPSAFARWALAFALGSVAAAPFIQGWAASWPAHARGPWNADSVPGGFPVAPVAAYFWLGSALGTCCWARGWPPARVALVTGGLAGALFAVGSGLHPPLLAWLGAQRFGQASPSLVLTRTAAALGIIAVLAGLSARARRLPWLVELCARRSLTFYLAHMLMLWGVPFVPGLVHRVGRCLDVPLVAGATLACLALIAAGCWLTRKMSQGRLTPEH
ncbi:MAG: DUF1624 domain-containing protein [Deltaproteobacteria bacterium]|nr:DUF1624 domain-containing protein [Deltaproteobacteria bacterium]